jgi:hypothetical protein
VQKFAMLPLLAQAAQPVLAHQVVVGRWSNMLVGARVAERTVALDEGFACWPRGVNAKAICLQQEWRETEGVFWVLVFKNLAREVFWTGAFGKDCGHGGWMLYYCWGIRC